MASGFDYFEAFSRNIGWFTEAEQAALRSKRVAIAGMGGVGGFHLLTLTRLGIGAFHIADLDRFELANFNRQAGATLSTLGQSKVAVLAAAARDINPALDLRLFEAGIDAHNVDAFLAGVDLYVDGLDFFAFEARALVFAACAARGIPAITAAPLGMGAALLNFLPGGMSFEEYFGWGNHPEAEKALRFLVGLAPAGLHRSYLVDPRRIDLEGRRGPSTVVGCELCAAVAGAEAVKILLKRGRVLAAPHGVQFDAFRNRLAHTWRPGGNRHPLNRLALALGRRAMARCAPTCREEGPAATPLERVLSAARWAPSGDNTQPWRFEVRGADTVLVHGTDTRTHCVYDLDGHPSQIAHGALLETLAIAASAEGWRTEITRERESPEDAPRYRVRFIPDPDVHPDPLLEYVPRRSVQRRPLSTRPLTESEKRALEAAVGDAFTVRWLEGFGPRWAAARLMFFNAKLRLTLPEAYAVHRDIIEWRARFSHDRVPDQAIGLDPLTTRIMEWVMGSWERVRFFNRYLAGTLAPRLQLDLIPGVACAAHFVLLSHAPPRHMDDFVATGRALQRFWLTATSLGLQLQPEVTPLVFARYDREGRTFTREPACQRMAGAIRQRLEALLGADHAARAVFMGRIGAGRAPLARSLRLPLSRLMIQKL